MRFASTRCSTPRGNRLRPKRSRPQPHTQGTYPSSPPAATLHGTNSRFRAPASSHTQVSCTVHVAISMRFAAPRTHPCSHYNAIRIPALQNTKGEHDPNRNRRTQEVPFTAACSHPTRKNTRFRARASSPCSHCTHTQCVLQHHVHIHAAITMRFASTRCRTPRENRLRSKRSRPQPHTQGTLHRRLQPRCTEKLTLSCSGFLSNPITMRFAAPCTLHAAITMRFASPRCRTPRENRLRVDMIQTATAAHWRYPSPPPATTLHGKTHGFVLRLPPQHKSHATKL